MTDDALEEIKTMLKFIRQDMEKSKQAIDILSQGIHYMNDYIGVIELRIKEEEDVK